MNAPLDRYELYRVITDYEALQDGFLDRIEDLNTTLEQIDMAAGLTKGNAQKLLSKNVGKFRSDRPRTPSRRTFGWESLPKMLRGTGLALVLAVDDERFAPIKEQLSQRKRYTKRIGANVQETPENIDQLVKERQRARMREIGIKGNKSDKRKAKRQRNFRRKMNARAAARARWSKRK